MSMEVLMQTDSSTFCSSIYKSSTLTFTTSSLKAGISSCVPISSSQSLESSVATTIKHPGPTSRATYDATAELLLLKADQRRKVWDHYTILGQLGQGGFSTVYEAVQKKNPKDQGCRIRRVAIKKIEVGDQNGLSKKEQDEARDDALKEARILIELRGHPNIIEFIDLFDHDGSIYIVQELMHCSLHDYLCTHGTLSEDTSARIIQKIALGL